MRQKIFSLFKKSKRRKTQHLGVKKSVIFTKKRGKKFTKRRKRIFLGYINKLLNSFRKKSTPSFIFGGIGISIFLGILLIFGPLFQVREINIYKQDSIIDITQAYSSVAFARNKNLLFLDTGELVKRLQKGQNAIQNIEFHIKPPHGLNIYLKSHPPIFQSEKYIILSNGSILEKQNRQIPELPLISFSKDIKEIMLFKKTLNPSDLKNINFLLKELEHNILGFSPQAIRYFITEKEVLITNAIGTIFLFDLNGSIEGQVKKLAIFQKEGVNISKKKYIYIDVRIPQRLFLCPYEEEYSCISNLKNIYEKDIFMNLEKESSLSLQ